MFASIPPPPGSELVLGPLRIHIYGLMIALAVLVGVTWARARYKARGGDPEDVSNIALWCVPAALIGTRIYHVITDYNSTYCGQPDCPKSLWPDAFKIWQGGLGIPGGILAGFLVGLWYVKRHKLDLPELMDVAAPVIPLGQAIGRLGNYFNQELFGRATSLPWALEVEPYADNGARRFSTEFADDTTFHPTFLYEMLWNLGVVGVLLLLERRGNLRKGKLFPAYVTLYFTGRMWIEALRIDQAAKIGGLRWNFVLSIIMIIVGLAWFFWGGVTKRPDEVTSTGPASDETAGSVEADPSAELEEDGVGEPGPHLEGPRAEVAATDGDEGQAGVGVEPE
ncbi:MAG TPA: prolipoprotein diacylglyceryl transferase, partial [Microthrixaceae bacterium]|nr:prolipoprotein diacylglyceryl transferase [Microthrixaceae bacterium]